MEQKDNAYRFDHFVSVISSLHKSIQKIKSLEMREFGLKGPHVMSLFYLSQSTGGMTAAQLSRAASVDRAAISRVLSELEEGGFIRYTDQAAGKKYRAELTLTEKGKEVAAKVQELISSIVELANRGLGDEETDSMYHCLNVISDNLNSLLFRDEKERK